MSPSSLCLSSKWLWSAAGTSKLSRQRGQMNPSWGEFPFSYVRVGESVTDFAFSAMFFRKFIFFHGKSAASHPWVWWGSAPLCFPLSPQTDRRGSSMGGRQVGFVSAGQQSAANTEQPQQVEKTSRHRNPEKSDSRSKILFYAKLNVRSAATVGTTRYLRKRLF